MRGVSTDGQSVEAQVAELTAAGASRVFREVASGASRDRAQLRRALHELDAGDVVMVTRLDRLARSTCDLLNTLAEIASKGADFRSWGDAWADTTTPHGRLMLTVLGGLAEFERELIPARTGEGRAEGQGPRCQARQDAQAHPARAARGPGKARERRGDDRDRPQLQRQPLDDFEAPAMNAVTLPSITTCGWRTGALRCRQHRDRWRSWLGRRGPSSAG
jgi:hypothetical protein